MDPEIVSYIDALLLVKSPLGVGTLGKPRKVEKKTLKAMKSRTREAEGKKTKKKMGGGKGAVTCFLFPSSRKQNKLQQLIHNNHQQRKNVIDFNLTAGLHTFVRETLLSREKKVSLCIHRDMP